MFWRLFLYIVCSYCGWLSCKLNEARFYRARGPTSYRARLRYSQLIPLWLRFCMTWKSRADRQDMSEYCDKYGRREWNVANIRHKKTPKNTSKHDEGICVCVPSRICKNLSVHSIRGKNERFYYFFPYLPIPPSTSTPFTNNLVISTLKLCLRRGKRRQQRRR